MIILNLILTVLCYFQNGVLQGLNSQENTNTNFVMTNAKEIAPENTTLIEKIGHGQFGEVSSIIIS